MPTAPVNTANYQTQVYKLLRGVRVLGAVSAASSGSSGNTTGVGQIYPLR